MAYLRRQHERVNLKKGNSAKEKIRGTRKGDCGRKVEKKSIGSRRCRFAAEGTKHKNKQNKKDQLATS